MTFLQTTFTAVALALPVSAQAANFLNGFSGYTAGTNITAAYQSPGTALGKPSETTGQFIVSPFNATFAGTEMVGIGPGGSLTLQFASPITVGAGREFGVHAGVNLFAAGNGGNTNPAATFNDRRAVVSVSDDGIEFFKITGDVPTTFNLPTNYYADLAGPPASQTTPGTVLADFGKPFNGSLSSFDGLDWDGTKQVLDGSAGGTWLDVSGVGDLATITHVRFDVPVPLEGQSGYRMFVDAVVGATPVPEPGVASTLLIGAGIAILGRRGRRVG